MTTKKEKYCKRCETTFPSIAAYDYHAVRGAYRCKHYKCKRCDERFFMEADLAAHVETHFIRFPCDVCAQQFNTETKLMDHKINAHNAEIKCQVCNKTFSYAYTLMKHIKEIHTNPRRCACGMKWADYAGLHHHEGECAMSKTGITNNTKRKFNELIANGCEASEAAIAAVKEAKDAALIRAACIIRCDQCDAVYDDPEGLKSHKRRNHK